MVARNVGIEAQYAILPADFLHKPRADQVAEHCVDRRQRDLRTCRTGAQRVGRGVAVDAVKRRQQDLAPQLANDLVVPAHGGILT